MYNFIGRHHNLTDRHLILELQESGGGEGREERRGGKEGWEGERGVDGCEGSREGGEGVEGQGWRQKQGGKDGAVRRRERSDSGTGIISRFSILFLLTVG